MLLKMGAVRSKTWTWPARTRSTANSFNVVSKASRHCGQLAELMYDGRCPAKKARKVKKEQELKRGEKELTDNDPRC